MQMQSKSVLTLMTLFYLKWLRDWSENFKIKKLDLIYVKKEDFFCNLTRRRATYSKCNFVLKKILGKVCVGGETQRQIIFSVIKSKTLEANSRHDQVTHILTLIIQPDTSFIHTATRGGRLEWRRSLPTDPSLGALGVVTLNSVYTTDSKSWFDIVVYNVPLNI